MGRASQDRGRGKKRGKLIRDGRRASDLLKKSLQRASKRLAVRKKKKNPGWSENMEDSVENKREKRETIVSAKKKADEKHSKDRRETSARVNQNLA